MSNKNRSPRYIIAAAIVAVTSVAIINDNNAYAAACTIPGTDYGTVTFTTSVSSAGTYRFWLRMAAPSSSANTVLLEVDGNTCYTAGGSSVPVYANGTATHFVSGTSNWTNRTSGGAVISQNLTSGSHTIKLIGTGVGVVIDRVIISADDSCTPYSAGDNCAMNFVAPDLDMNGNVNFLDFSRLANRYGQTNALLGRTDINGDGTINFLDYSLLASKYGQ